jgi:hypothetical protein
VQRCRKPHKKFESSWPFSSGLREVASRKPEVTNKNAPKSEVEKDTQIKIEPTSWSAN